MRPVRASRERLPHRRCRASAPCNGAHCIVISTSRFCRVPPVPRSWGPGRAYEASASLPRASAAPQVPSVCSMQWCSLHRDLHLKVLPGTPGPSLLGTGESMRPVRASRERLPHRRCRASAPCKDAHCIVISTSRFCPAGLIFTRITVACLVFGSGADVASSQFPESSDPIGKFSVTW
jgi:hypothetical protein